MNVRAAVVFSLLSALPSTAQIPQEAPPPPRKLVLITQSQTLNYIAKFDSGTGTVGNSVLYENNGNLGIGTTDPKSKFHLYGTGDVFLGLGADPSGATGSALNIGYGGASFGRATGFFNVRPDALALAPNPSLRFATGNVEQATGLPTLTD